MELTIILSLGMFNTFIALPKLISPFPIPYTSAVSKKFIPFSTQNFTDSNVTL